MKRRDGRSRKTPESVSAPADKKNSVGVRRLRSYAIRRHVEQTLMHVLVGALLLAFPESAVRDTARFVMKASATRGSLTSARRYAKRGHSRRQMARVMEALEQGKLQRLITCTLRKQAAPFIPDRKCTVAIDLHLVSSPTMARRTGRASLSPQRRGTAQITSTATPRCIW